MGLSSRIFLTIGLLGIAFCSWLYHRIEITYDIMLKGLNDLYNYLLSHIQELTLKDINYAYDNWLYDYYYTLWRPWIKSAIKPEYRSMIESRDHK